MKKGTSKRLTPEQRAELKSLAVLPDDAIDTSDAPELLDRSGGPSAAFSIDGVGRVDGAKIVLHRAKS